MCVRVCVYIYVYTWLTLLYRRRDGAECVEGEG